MPDQPRIQLSNNVEIPQLGLGTYQLTGDTCRKAVAKALDVGYRHIDTASRYGNQKEIGEELANASVKREEVFITSKVWRDSVSADAVREACVKTLEQLDTDYLDLYLIHWPVEDIPVAETLTAMQALQDDDLIKAIGVSNFTIELLEEVLETDVTVVNNQVEFHPTLHQSRLKEFCDENDITITAYSPLAQGKDIRLDLIQHIAKKHDRSGAQVVLNWLKEKGLVAIPRSKHPDHIEDNFKTLEWQLDDEDVAAIDDIGRFERVINPEFGQFPTE